ncbi:MAG: helix-turn-helix transcriptional regulator [Crocinitomicaceae bacterium]|nr:helix-turn-helix transcriptional regulator [Crocinitomicaceae bacterium]
MVNYSNRNNTIGVKIRKIREIKNFSQEYVANKLSVSQSTYSNIENDKTPVTAKSLEQIALALEVTPAIIKGFDDQMVFESCSQPISFHSIHLPASEKEALYIELIQQLKERIRSLEAIIALKEDNLPD